MSVDEEPEPAGDSEYPPGRLLMDAVTEAVETGLAELTRLDAVVAEAQRRFDAARDELSPRGLVGTRREDGFTKVLEGVVADLTNGLADSRRAASTFNIAFFGRTGAGKSTLLSALGGLSGELVSDGRSDFTTDVQPLDWQGCRLYDTPGINGWGRTRSRAELEETARKTVEVADVVLLCFDSQSQQASEFRKVANWVRDYRKPVLAVLNVRNAMWRNPARVASLAQRNGLSRTARQHADNIASELEAIGLTGVPIVAIQSKRALFARAATPFVGPAASELEADRSAYGREYLDRWSNLPVLEQLIALCIAEGAADLRLSALREGLQAGLRQWADEIDRAAVEQQARGLAVERVVADWLTVLGYPEESWRGALPRSRAGDDLLAELEEARGEPFGASVSGRLEGHVRHLLKSHVYPLRVKALRAAEELIIDAFDNNRSVSDSEFERRVYDFTSIAKIIYTVSRQAGDFVTDSLKLSGLNAEIDVAEIDRAAAEVRGDTGAVRRHMATLLRTSGLLAGSAGAVLGIIALTNFWNPAGWVAAVVLVGLGSVSTALNFLARRTSTSAEGKRVGARAAAVAAARTAVHTYFDKCETEQLQKILSAARTLASPGLEELLKDAIHTRRGCGSLIDEIEWLRDQADRQPPTASPSEVIQRANQQVHLLNTATATPGLSALLLGEDWIVDESESEAPVATSVENREILQRAAREDRIAFSEYVTEAASRAVPPNVADWINTVATSPHLDDEGRIDAQAAEALMAERPVVVVMGDYSAGKTSLIKRLLAEVGAPTPSDLHIAAGPATAATRSYAFGSLDLVDVPGFQSGHSAHDEQAAEAARNAALAIVVLHVNLLIGDTAGLDRLLRGDDQVVGKLTRSIFVIGRIDEAGADPRISARDFIVRRQRKAEELLTILRSSGITADPSQVLALAADPNGLVGDRTPVTREDYPNDARDWDGVATLCGPLLALGSSELLHLGAAAALDRMRSGLAAASYRLVSEIDDLAAATVLGARMERLVEASLAELRLIELSIEGRTKRVVEDHANEVVAEALGARSEQIDAMSRRLATWWEDPRLGSALEILNGEVGRELDEWSRRHASEYDRELKRFEYESTTASQNGRHALAGGVHAAAVGAKHVGAVVKAVGNRDAVYAIVKAFGGKFKPWGAVKLGAKVAKVGAVLGVVAVGFDVVDWAMDAGKESKREDARKSAAKLIRATTYDVVRQILDGEDGPMQYAREQESNFASHLRQLVQQREHQEQAIVDAEYHRDGIVELQVAGERLAGTSTERVSR